MRRHIMEQIYTRIFSMDKECYSQGQCKICGCKTTALQMANKPCDKPCYPKMVSKSKWQELKQGKAIYCKTTKKYWKIKNGQFIQL